MANLSEIKKDSNWGDTASTLNSNFQKINVDLEKVKSATTKFRGYFTSETVLKQKYPSPQVGDTAYVGEPYPDTVYDVQVAGTWHNTGKAPDTDSVDLTDYARKEELTEVSNKVAGINYVTCDTAASTAAKTVSITGLTSLTTGIRMLVKMTNNNTASNATLNINSLGAKPLYYDKTRATSGNSWEAGEVIDIYYDGTNFYSSNVQGGSSDGGNKTLTWNTDAATTRKQVQLKDRKELLIISYKDGEGNIVNEQYIGTSLNDDSWSDSSNWQSFQTKENIEIISGTGNFTMSRYLSTAGVMGSAASPKEYVLDFYPVKKNEKIKILTISDDDGGKSVFCFYSDKTENSVIDIISPKSSTKYAYKVNVIEYTPSQDGYIRVYNYYSGLSVLGYELPIIAIGDSSVNYLNNILYNTASENIEYSGIEYLINKFYLSNDNGTIGTGGTQDYISKSFIRLNKGDIATIYTGVRNADSFQIYSEDTFDCIYKMYDAELVPVEHKYEATNNCYLLINYNAGAGDTYNGKDLPYIKIEKADDSSQDSTIKSVTNITELDGVEDYSLENLFDKNNTRAYDSEFANKVESAIGRKTDSTGCYSNNIPCQKGDWFTRSDFGTGIIVVLDSDENILGDIKNAAYSPTIQIAESDGQDFSNAANVVFVVPLANVDTEKIVKAKYLPTEQGDYFKMPKFRIDQLNIPNGLDYPIKSTSGRFYSIIVDDSGEEPILKYILQEGIPMANLPQNFPLFSITGDFSKYYDYLIFCPVEGGVTNYLYELSSTGLVARYINKKVNCPRILKENDEWYFYGVDGNLNNSNGKLNIYKANGETFELVKGDLGNSAGESIEPHDCLVISVNPLHYICQRYVSNQTTVVDGESKVVTALHLEEVYEGEKVWEWHSEDYPELWMDSNYQGNNADYLHNNSISIAPDGNLYINNKQANQMLVIERTWDDSSHTGTIGDILWKIGGDSDHSGWDVPTRIKTTTEQQWYESHDGVVNSEGLITMYDNKASGASRILEFNIDTENKQLINFKSYTFNGYRGRYMGSVDKCAEGIYLVSWGSSRSGDAANAGLYDFNTGKALFEIRFNATGSSAYRVYGIKKGQK